MCFNPLTPNDPYKCRTARLTSKRCILYIYSTNIGTEYFKHGIYSPFFPLKNAVCFIILTAPNIQHTANQARYDQCGNQRHSRKLLMMGIVMPETCSAYKKYNKKWHLVGFLFLS